MTAMQVLSKAKERPPVGKRLLSAEQLLIWAYARQRAHVYGSGKTMLFAIEAEMDGIEYHSYSTDGIAVIERDRKIGCTIDTSPHVTRTVGDIHPDAEAIHDMLEGLIVGEGSVGITLVRQHALAGGTRPDWRPFPRWRYAPRGTTVEQAAREAMWALYPSEDDDDHAESYMRLQAYHAIEDYRPRSMRLTFAEHQALQLARNPKTRTRGDALLDWVTVMPVAEVDHPDAITSVRENYQAWWRVLEAMMKTMRKNAGALTHHEASDSLPHPTPWDDPAEVERARMLLDYKGYGNAP